MQGTHERRALFRGSAVVSGMTELPAVVPANLRVGFAAASRAVKEERAYLEQAQNPNQKKWNATGTGKRRDKGGRAETGGLAQRAQERRDKNAGVLYMVDV